ncbi:hypothetical protein PFICI_12642 [Pestalotiopsis fici W106-1]|uniref:NB-ARC domain-containing protein n=1 Tax=Pestalotiopsis fici (strain W106-1 / CGMCC3.15140) TaxID=1229662 RepID=W3WPA5_PESFW|nr:uncharacterized protein PFICI_12642 [Pestalotiopsis fici W106-1]ETS75698.1 hypothetical protein PFICI_12642 [Pestalotiopsis fici W106-1]
MLPLRNHIPHHVSILDPRDYEVVWIAPLEIEARAALYLLDERFDGKFAVTRGDEYVYHAGRMCGHKIVIAALPAGQEYGTGSAAALASQVKKFFPNLWFGLLVGVAAGLPDLTRKPPRDIRLGDVLVGLPQGDGAGLIAYDLGKETASGFQPLRGGQVLAMTEPIVRSAISNIKLEAPNDAHKFLPYYEAIRDKEHADGTFADPGESNDALYLVTDDETIQRVDRVPRPKEKRTRVWYGPIGSGEKLSKSARVRDELRDRYGLIGLEMEAAGTMNRIPVGVIRGVCDYGDEHKNKEWQPYASAMAAAYGKAVLAEIVPMHKPTAESPTENKPTTSDKSTGPFYYMQMSKNARFTGRAAILQALQEKLFGQQPCERVALVGLGGVGKTQIAVRFAYQIKESQSDCSIFWVPLLGKSSLEQAYIEIAKRIGLQQNKDEDIKDLVCRYLSSDQAGQWLMVVDNADDRDLLFGESDSTGVEEFLPQSEQGSILLTTRSKQVAVEFSQGEVFDVEQMSYDEALPFLEKSLHKIPGPQDDNSIRELFTHLTYLPLAIAQAAAYLNENMMPIRKYLGLLRGAENDVARVLGRDFKDYTRYRSSRNAIATTWLISFEQIQKSNRAATKILSFLSCIEPKAIPESILPKCESEVELQEAIGMLCGYSFLVRRGDSDVFDMHHLVQLATRGWIEKGGMQEEALSEGVSHLASTFPSDYVIEHDTQLQYLPHAFRVLARSSDLETAERAHLCMNVGICLFVDRRFKEAIGYFEVAYHYRKTICPEDDHSRRYSESMLASTYLDARRIREAIEIFEHLTSVNKTILVDESAFRLAAEHELARAYFENRQTQKAIEILEHVVLVRRRILDEKDGGRVASEQMLAAAYSHDGRLKEAIEILEPAASVRNMTLAEEDHDRLTTEYSLGSAYHKDGRIKEAIRILEHVVSVRRKTLAEEDHDQLLSQHELASAYLDDGRVKEAIEIFEHVVSIKRTTLAEGDHQQLASQHELARAYLDDGRVEEAIEILEYVVSMQRMTLAKADDVRLLSECVLARAYLADYQAQKAIDLLENIVALRQQDDPKRPYAVDLLLDARDQLEAERGPTDVYSDSSD